MVDLEIKGGFTNQLYNDSAYSVLVKLLNEKGINDNKIVGDIFTGFSKCIGTVKLKKYIRGVIKRHKLGDVDTVLSEIQKNMTDEGEAGNLRVLLSESETRREGIHTLAKHCIGKFHLFTIRDNDEIYLYNDGVYLPNGKRILAGYVQKNMGLGDCLTSHVINEFWGHIRRYTYSTNDKLQEPKNLICLQNGVLRIDNLKLEPHNPNQVFLNKLPVIYDEIADCPKIQEFLTQIIPEDLIPVLQELIGYCLYKGYPIHKAFMLVGTGANGKSTFINLLKSFLGQEFCASIPLYQLETNRFAGSSLFGKLANLFADLPSRALKETSIFKMLTGEDLIPAEKKFQDQFFFTNYAKLIFSCNQIPASPDDSDAFFRRWIIINFPNQFLNDKADKKLLTKLTIPEELSGLLNFAIEGLKRLVEGGDFSITKSIEEVREEYIRRSDSVASFLMDMIQAHPEKYVPKKELYTAYCDYCRDLNAPIKPENTFHKELQQKIRVEDYRPNLEVDGRKQRILCWKGIQFLQLNREKNPDNPDNPDQSVSDVSDVKAKSYLLLRNFNENEIVNQICAIDNCEETECNYDSKGVLYCRKHFEEMAN